MLPDLIASRQRILAGTFTASRAIEAMRTALKTGDAGAALTAAGQLPDWARGVAGDWLAGLGDRVAADKAIATLTGRLVDRLNATATRP